MGGTSNIIKCENVRVNYVDEYHSNTNECCGVQRLEFNDEHEVKTG